MYNREKQESMNNKAGIGAAICIPVTSLLPG